MGRWWGSILATSYPFRCWLGTLVALYLQHGVPEHNSGTTEKGPLRKTGHSETL